MRRWLVCGVAGGGLEGDERATLERLAPGGVVLFARNVVAADQLRALVGALHGLPGRPYVAIDLEGGRVNRLLPLIGPLPPAARAAAAGMEGVAALGAALAAACAHFGIDVDFAPVVDVARPGGWLASEERCLGSAASEIEAAAAEILARLEAYGVAGCLKHYPGLGAGGVDSHRDLPLLTGLTGAEVDLFHRLARPTRAVMVAHALSPTLGEAVRPASLSATIVGRLHRAATGPIIADDLEMGALAGHGSLGERAAAALRAGCDQVLVCNALAEREAVVAHVEAWAARDPVLAAALHDGAARLAGFGYGPQRAVEWHEVVASVARARGVAGEGP